MLKVRNIHSSFRRASPAINSREQDASFGKQGAEDIDSIPPGCKDNTIYG